MTRRTEARASRGRRYGRTALAALAATGAAAGGVAAFGGFTTAAAASSGKVIDLTLWESHSGATNPVAEAEAHIVSMFNSSQSNVHMKILETHASTKSLAAAEAGSPPVIAEISHYDGAFVSAGLIINQTPLMQAKGSGFTPSQLASFYPSAIINGRIPQALKNGKPVPGKQYRTPADSKVSEMFYNKQMFKQAGIAGCPATYNQLGTDLVKLKKRFGFTPMGWKDSTPHIYPAIIANGGGIYNPAHKATTFDSPAGITTFKQFRSWYAQGLMVITHGSTMRPEMASKKLAIEEGTSAGWAKVLAATKGHISVGVCPEPAGTSGHTGNLVQGLDFVIFSKHSAADQNAAFQFVKFWNSPKAAAYWSEHSGYPPEVSSAVPLMSHFLNSYAGAGQKVSIQELTSRYTTPRGVSDAYAEVDSALDAAFFNYVTGKDTNLSATLKNLDAAAAKYLKGQAAI